MISFDVIVAFFLLSALLALAPGPDIIFVFAESARCGFRAGLMVTAGLCTGLIAHTSAVALGVAVIFETSTFAFTALKVTGALYLLYLAWQAFKETKGELKMGEQPVLTRRRLYLRGIVMNVSNPKVSVFFLAFLPQFASPERGSIVAQILVLGAVFTAATILVFGSVAFFAGSAGQMLGRSARAQRLMNRLAGTVFAALAIRLLITER